MEVQQGKRRVLFFSWGCFLGTWHLCLFQTKCWYQKQIGREHESRASHVIKDQSILCRYDYSFSTCPRVHHPLHFYFSFFLNIAIKYNNKPLIWLLFVLNNNYLIILTPMSPNEILWSKMLFSTSYSNRVVVCCYMCLQYSN